MVIIVTEVDIIYSSFGKECGNKFILISWLIVFRDFLA